MTLTQDAVEYRSTDTTPTPAPPFRRHRAEGGQPMSTDRRPPMTSPAANPPAAVPVPCHLRAGRARGMDQAAVVALHLVGAGRHHRVITAGRPRRRRVAERHGRQPRHGRRLEQCMAPRSSPAASTSAC